MKFNSLTSYLSLLTSYLLPLTFLLPTTYYQLPTQFSFLTSYFLLYFLTSYLLTYLLSYFLLSYFLTFFFLSHYQLLTTNYRLTPYSSPLTPYLFFNTYQHRVYQFWPSHLQRFLCKDSEYLFLSNALFLLLYQS